MKNRYSYWYFITPVLFGIILLFIPLLGDFHIESALLVSLAGCFWAGIRACDENIRKDDFTAALQISGSLLLVGFPLLVHALFAGCFSIDGLAFWILFPLPSVFFGYAIGRLFRNWNLPYRRWAVTVILLVIGVGIFFWELLSYPQVYFFNHVWGGWPGPIYDEVVRINGATVFFRGLTILWALLLWHIPALKLDPYSKWIVGFSAVALAIGYSQLAEFGVISPRSHLQHVLNGHRETEHFELYYDDQLYSKYEIDQLAKEHEFYLNQISDRLDLPQRDSTDKIESYLYAHPWQKKQLVGAKFTSYVPVWLKQDQLHIAKQQIASSLKHELVHVLAKQFGNKLFNASWSVGMVEGLAVAIDGGSSLSSTIDQIVVSEEPYPSARDLQKAFSPWGFYGGRSGVNYITSGSFVKYLLDNYPARLFKRAYQKGNIDSVYPKNWNALAEDWHQHLDSVQVDSVDRRIASRIFGIPSLFEQQCPHVVSDFAIAWDNYEFNLANHDTARAVVFLNRAVADADSLPPIKAEWSYRQLMAQNSGKVQRAASLQDTTVNLQLLYADAFAMTSDWEQAERHINQAEKLFAQKPDSLAKPALATRLNRRQWEIYRQMTYHNKLPDSTSFAKAYYRTRIRSLRKAMDQQQWKLVDLYASQLLTAPLDLRYFDDYLSLIHQLAFRKKYKLARSWIQQIFELALRARYQERLQQERKWLEFLGSQ